MIKAHWFPNALTAANLFCGFSSILLMIHASSISSGSQQLFIWAGLTICLAALCDALDGRLARTLHVTSAFGKELDSLADIISFGVAPAVLVYEHAVPDDRMQFLWVLVTGIFVCCGAARLARYNMIGSSGRLFIGMPIPAAGLAVTSMVIFPTRIGVDLLLPIILLCSFLMISTLRYPTWEYVALDAALPIRILFLLLFVVVVINPSDYLFLMPVAYLVYGLIWNVFEAMRPKEV